MAEVTLARGTGSLAGALPTICARCGRPARGFFRLRLPGTSSGVGGWVGLSEGNREGQLLDDLEKLITSTEAIELPVCWWHRWIVPPVLSVQAVTEATVTVAGVAPEFAAACRDRPRPAGPEQPRTPNPSAPAAPTGTGLTPLQRASRALFFVSLLLFAGEVAWLCLSHENRTLVTVDLARAGASLLLLGLTWCRSEKFWQFGVLSVGLAALYAVPLFAGGLFVLTEPGGITHGLSKYGPIAAFFALLTGFGLAGVLLFRRALRASGRNPESWTV